MSHHVPRFKPPREQWGVHITHQFLPKDFHRLTWEGALGQQLGSYTCAQGYRGPRLRVLQRKDVALDALAGRLKGHTEWTGCALKTYVGMERDRTKGLEQNQGLTQTWSRIK